MEIGENVLHPVIRFPSKQPLTLLRILLIGYVHHHADEAIRFTVLAVQALATRLDPADVSVLLKEPIFLSVLCSGGHGLIDSLSDPLNVVRMYAREVF